METIKELFSQLYDVKTLIHTVGYIGMIVIIFSETGLLAGFFLPGDSLLVTAGLFAATGEFDIILLNVMLIPAAVIGDAVGYWIGHKSGPHLFKKEQSLLFRKDYLIKTQEFYNKYGGITIILARFIPIIRTFAPTVAGIAQMKYIDFFKYNVIGGALWILSMTLLGYLLGNTIPNIDKHIEEVIVVIVFLSFLPIIYKFVSAKMKKSNEDKAK